MSKSVSLTPRAIAGINIAVGSCGIKKPGKVDLCVFELAEQSVVSAVFTRNAFCAAPVLVAKDHLQQAAPRYLVINTGNANAGTGAQGLLDARATCHMLAEKFVVSDQQVLPFSTGVIGQALPMTKLASGIAALPAFAADADQWTAAAHAIMTTDTRAKMASVQVQLSGGRVSLSGIAKGAGMICPNMATMLGFIATDLQVQSAADLDALFKPAVDKSFNSITVDGDTSTNDACVLIASGQSKVTLVSAQDKQVFLQALEQLCISLAQQIVRDAEGATKFITIQVNGGQNSEECREVAYTIAHSPLVKTAFFASDANWGRILAAIGRSPLKALSVDQVSIFLDDVCVINHGQPAVTYSEAAGSAVMARAEITLRVELGRGAASSQLWTCDLSHDYVTINADYRS